MFSPIIAKTNLIDALNKIEFGKLGIRPDPVGLKLRASGIDLACELFTNFIQEMAADADASISSGKVHDRDALAISDVGKDLAGQIEEAIERIREDA